MKFWAKLRFKGEKNARYLIKAFFQEFNAESSIIIRGKEANIEIVFKDNPPMEIIKALEHCDVIEFNYGKELGKYGEKGSLELQVENNEKTDENSKHTKQTDDSKRKRKVERKNPNSKKLADIEKVKVPELEEIAKKSISFRDFIKEVAEWLELEQRQEFFENLVIAATEVDSISWKKLEKNLHNKGVIYSQWEKIRTGQQVSEKFRDYSITLMPFLTVMKQYKDYSFQKEQYEEISAEVTEIVTGKRVKMECMPEITCFEETLASVDKTQSVEERVKYVLNAMGLESRNEKEKDGILEIANAAVRLKNPEWSNIGEKLDINFCGTDFLNKRMLFSQFINDFTSKYDSNNKVKLLDFLKELQEIVMNEGEIEDFIN